MKNLMILVFISICMMGCKDQEKREDSIIQPTMEERAMETKDDNIAALELGCYEYKTEGIDVKMKITKIEGDAVTANLYYIYAEKDQNEGTFFGNLHGDKLIGQYTFMSEGKENIRDVAFKVEKNQIVEGFGELDEGGTKFKDSTQLTYSTTTPWKKTSCK
jgi:hypothetical protein